MDPPEYYAGRFLTYRNGVRAFVEQLKHARYNGSMPFFLQNWVAAAYQLATLRCAGLPPWCGGGGMPGPLGLPLRCDDCTATTL